MCHTEHVSSTQRKWRCSCNAFSVHKDMPSWQFPTILQIRGMRLEPIDWVFPSCGDRFSLVYQSTG